MLTHRTFLSGLFDMLQESVREAENLGWHHGDDETPQFQHYLRLLSWLEEVYQRMVRYDFVKARNQPHRWQPVPERAAPTEPMAGYRGRLGSTGGGAVRGLPPGGSGGAGRDGDDSSTDDC